MCLSVSQLPIMAKALGKRVFKRHLELFLDVMFYGMVGYATGIVKSSSGVARFA